MNTGYRISIRCRKIVRHVWGSFKFMCAPFCRNFLFNYVALIFERSCNSTGSGGKTHLALDSNSSSSGKSRDSMMPRFILAGSRAQFERPMNATGSGVSSVSMTSSDDVTPSSSRGCSVLSGIRGESSARPTSSSTTTETNLSKRLFCCSLWHCRKVATIPSGVVRGLHWYDNRCAWKTNVYFKPLCDFSV